MQCFQTLSTILVVRAQSATHKAGWRIDCGSENGDLSATFDPHLAGHLQHLVGSNASISWNGSGLGREAFVLCPRTLHRGPRNECKLYPWDSRLHSTQTPDGMRCWRLPVACSRHVEVDVAHRPATSRAMVHGQQSRAFSQQLLIRRTKTYTIARDREGRERLMTHEIIHSYQPESDPAKCKHQCSCSSCEGRRHAPQSGRESFAC